MAERSGFPYGASYSPLIYPEVEWDNDLRQMQAASMNLVRIGDVHGSWDRIEPRPGEFEWDILERFYRAAGRFGVRVMISTGASSPPLWLARQHPDVSILSSRGERYPLGASYHWACIHHPAFRAASENYLRALVDFVSRQTNHFGWQISNEIGFPFMPARERNDLGLYCYCEYCQQAFRAWVQQKYATLDALTNAWSWSTTNFVYNSWDDVFAPESLPASWSGVTRWIDWRLFWQQAMAQFTGWQHQIIRERDSSHPTSVNTFNFKGFDRFGTYMGLDQWQIAGQVDHIGYDLYPGSGDKRKTRPEHTSMFLDHGRSVAQSTGRDFWIHELESGPIGGWLMGPEHDTGAEDILNGGMECLGHAARLILYMPWREWGYQPIRWGALVELDSTPTSRLNAAAQLGAFLQENEEFLAHAQTPPAEIAILESKPNAIFFRGVDEEEILFGVQRAAYRAFWDLGFSVDYITPDLLDLERLCRYRVVCLPLVGLMSQETARCLLAYVEQGGTLVGFARTAALDERGWYQPRLPVSGLARAFGHVSLRAAKLDGQRIHYQGVLYEGWLNRDIAMPEPQTQVLAAFTDGVPAATLASCGKGVGLYIATQPNPSQAGSPESFAALLIQDVLARFGIVPRLRVESAHERARGVDPHLLETPARTFILFSNDCAQETAATLWLRLDGRAPVFIRQMFPVPSPLEWKVSGEFIQLFIPFPAKEVKGVEIHWRE